MAADVWTWLSFLAKAMQYGATAAVIGGHCSLALIHGQIDNRRNELHNGIARYLRIAALTGMVAAVSFFFIQVGAFAEAGFAGMFNRTLAKIILNSSVGYAVVPQSIGFSMLLAIGFSESSKNYRPNRRREIFFHRPLLIIALLLIIGAYWPVGHLVDEPVAVRLLLIAHVMAVAWWLGSLYPLLHVIEFCERPTVQALMRRFGNIAVLVVGILLLCGALLASVLVGSWGALFTTGYGRALLVKLLLVALLLSLAATNKFILVPRLIAPGLNEARAAKRLVLTITMELIAGLLILFTTAALTTVIGINHE